MQWFNRMVWKIRGYRLYWRYRVVRFHRRRNRLVRFHWSIWVVGVHRKNWMVWD